MDLMIVDALENNGQHLMCCECMQTHLTEEPAVHSERVRIESY